MDDIKAARDHVISAIASAARHHERCPTNDMLARSCHAVGLRFHLARPDILARAGMLRIEVYGQNYRVIEITHGPNKGLRTLPHPRFVAPYKVIEGEGR